MRSANILASIGGAAAIAAFIAAATTAAPRHEKSYNQCQREARSLGWNLNDESDMEQANKYIANCQYGEQVRTNSRSEPVYASKQQRQPERRAVARQSDFDRRALAQAGPKYRQQAAPMLEFCRDVAVFRAWNFRDEEDISQANKFMQDCMRGMRSR